MSDPFHAMLDAEAAESIAGDDMIAARRAYYARLDEYASATDAPWNPDAPTIKELSDAYEAAYAAWEQAHIAAGRALSEWLKTVI